MVVTAAALSWTDGDAAWANADGGALVPTIPIVAVVAVPPNLTGTRHDRSRANPRVHFELWNFRERNPSIPGQTASAGFFLMDGSIFG